MTKIMNIALVFVSAAAIMPVGCGKDNDADTVTQPSITTFVDTRDGQTYKAIQIGSQVWMAENLNYDVPGDTTDVCYENSADNCAKYGRLYNWAAAMKACPAGWKLPLAAEWGTLVNYVGGSSIAGGKLKSSSGWKDNGNGTDDYLFSALPGGGNDGGGFDDIGYYGYWWSASEYGAGRARYRGMDDDVEYVYWSNRDKANLFSVRCLQE